MSQYDKQWKRWLNHLTGCEECQLASRRPKIGQKFNTYCENGTTLLRRLEEVARLEDDE